MPQSLSFVLIHYIFSTKDRARFITDRVRPGLHAYLAETVRNAGNECYIAGGTDDHVHLAVRQARTATVAELVETMKTSSSRWIKTQSPDLTKFAWQRGYGAFSVGPTDLDALCDYIRNQEEHHDSRSFQDEFLAFMDKYEIDYDERYVWD